MATEDGIRGLLVEQLGVAAELIDQLQLIDLALALGENLAIGFPLYRLRHLRTYRDLSRAARDVLNEQLGRDGEFYVRARLRAAHVNVVRVGALTPTFATALADDLRQAPSGARVEIAVPDDFTDAALEVLRKRLAWLLGTTAPLVVRRAADLGPDIPVPWDRMTQGNGRAHLDGSRMQSCRGGIAVAVDAEDTPFERRRFPA